MRSSSRLLATLLALPLLCILPSHHAAATPRVVASIAPLHSLAAAVMEGTDTPRLLLRGGESPHSFSLRPSDARMLHDADILFWIGPTLEQPLARILPNLGTSHTVALIDTPGLELLPNRQSHASDPHSHHAADVSPARQSGAGIDPHIWLSPGNAAVLVEEIRRVESGTSSQA